MENCLELNSFVNDIKTILPLANCHMVNFLTENVFVDILPKCLQEEILAIDVDELNDTVRNNFTNTSPRGHSTIHLLEFLRKANMLSLKQNKFCYPVKDLCEKLVAKGFSEVKFNQVKHLMSEKKSHEVEMMSGIISTMAKAENCSHIVDIGGGKGYLSSILALKHKLKVLSVDSSLITSKGAAKQLPKVEVS